MLVQTNTYIVPAEKRGQHERLMRRFRETLLKLGCEQFEVMEQRGPDFAAVNGPVVCVQVMRFRDRQHKDAVTAAERKDPEAQKLIREFSELVDLKAQGEEGTFGVAYYAAEGMGGNA